MTRQASNQSYTVFYDAQCPICLRSRRIIERLGSQPTVRFIDVNDKQELDQWPMIDPNKATKRVTVLTPDHKKLTAYEAVINLLAARSRFIRFFLPLLQSSLMRKLGNYLYTLVSKNRYGIARVLRIDETEEKQKLNLIA